jgi:hypothetical protein
LKIEVPKTLCLTQCARAWSAQLLEAKATDQDG